MICDLRHIGFLCDQTRKVANQELISEAEKLLDKRYHLIDKEKRIFGRYEERARLHLVSEAKLSDGVRYYTGEVFVSHWTTNQKPKRSNGRGY